MYAFLDLETTALKPAEGSIVEIACVLTDAQLNELGAYQTLVKPLAAHEDASDWAPALFKARPRGAGVKHRALDDARASLELARYYRRRGLFGRTTDADVRTCVEATLGFGR